MLVRAPVWMTWRGLNSTGCALKQGAVPAQFVLLSPAASFHPGFVPRSSLIATYGSRVMDKASNVLAQLSGSTFLSDAGLETALVFLEGLHLPCFAVERQVGLIFDTPTWGCSIAP
jgi:hypothetical protein